MVQFKYFILGFLFLFNVAGASLLLDYNASRDDDVSKMGLLNLEAERGNNPKSNIPELYIKSDKDWSGKKSAHFHRKRGYIRTEYHALNKKTKEGTTYFIGYQFAVGATPDALMVWQWKSYEGKGANIPLSLEVRKGKLNFQFSSGASAPRTPQWSTAIKPKTVYTVGIEILAKEAGGHARLWWNGKPVTFETTKSTTLGGDMFPGRADPKFGAYRGEDVQVDTWVYQVQIADSKGDVDSKFF